ncbi:acyltransferase family protein [Lactobacillus sp. Sy-1]|uniref:acyltransferase family protein n=1 Tax=Lactobacillus sp. Sy-1 TaxID=2109645 RepID=UPI001C575665|nr:acyltransferase family protein [Lactobacillus sp. Sy-1]MBW1605463.1 acetyltransferase [Lactobacillus sp. Sy-1]
MQSKSTKNDNRRYITGLDGIRAIAVIAVIIYHLLPFSIKGGYLGVSIFFTVSGYLITDLLMQEWERTGTINLKSFYYRRVRRLYPALFTMVIGTGAYITLFQRGLLKNLGVSIWTNLLYVYNWWEIDNGQSYFDRFQGESPFTHLWSLSIEAQYYLVWPILLILLLLILKLRIRIFFFLTLASFSGAAWMTYVYAHTDNINRVYYGTDTRMFSILFGVALAALWPSNQLKHNLTPMLKTLVNCLGLSALTGIIWLLFTLSGQSAATYTWGMLLITIFTTLLIATCVHPGGSINQMLTNPVFRWIGTRSYGIYLYQFPVMIFYEIRGISIGEHPFMNALVEIAIILTISELSYRFIEEPIRHFNFKSLRVHITEFFKLHSQFGLKRLIVVPVVVLIVICGYGASHPSSEQADAGDLKRDIQNNQKAVQKKNRLLAKQRAAKNNAANSSVPKNTVKLTGADAKIAKDYDLNSNQVTRAKQFQLTAVGDSIMADASADLQKVFPNAYVSAQVGRQIWQTPGVVNQLKGSNALAPNVILNLGTNSPMNPDQMERVIKEIGPGHQIYWINVHVPTRYWEGQVNNVIQGAAKNHPNFHVIDWYQASRNQTSWFWDDHVHPNPTGNLKYVSLIAKTIFK